MQQEIISALSKDLKNYIYQKYDEFFIESALRFFMKPDKKVLSVLCGNRFWKNAKSSLKLLPLPGGDMNCGVSNLPMP